MKSAFAPLSPAETLVFAKLRAAARNASPCPTNDQIAGWLGCGISRASSLVTGLERRGLIDVVRFTAGRVVTIREDGARTAPVGGTLHWSSRGVVRVMPMRKERESDDAAKEAVSGPFTVQDRDACFFCGVRADLGCAHQAASEPVEMS